jgi:AmmeMemoRadiSam system protein B
MSIDSLPDHIQRPHLRPIQPMPLMKDGKQFIALRDPAMLVQQTMVVPVGALPILQQFRGEHRLTEIADRVHGSRLEDLAELAKRLDQLGLLWGPTFKLLEDELRRRLQERGALPIRATAMLGKDAAMARSALQDYFDKTEDPEIGGEIAGIVSPHLDYQRGWPNYAAAYHCLDEDQRPDRAVILGTNHFGLGDGVVLANLAFDTPLGRCPIDQPLQTELIERLGQRAVIDHLDHLPEHSVELQLPWLQHIFGDLPIIAALVPDPLTAMIKDDGERVKLAEFVIALHDALAKHGGKTLFVASSDLSHVGPQFGEPRPVDDQRRHDVERHDRDMMAKFLTADYEEFLSAMRWSNNPTRWCSVGNMTALLMLARPESVELIDYRQACDPKGMALVSSAAMAVM